MDFLRNKHHAHDPVWHAQIVVLLAIAFQVVLPNEFSLGGGYVIPALELVLLTALSITTPRERIFRSFARRINAILLIVVTTVANVYALGHVVDRLLTNGHVTDGRALILAAINIYLTNIIIFGLWYWEMDGGGPGSRQRIQKYEQDFLFPQHRNERYKHPEWRPTFIDYLYVSSTNAMALSPTDTMPLSRRAKMMMLVQSALSLITLALVAARAVSILG